jgi:biotin operon repressor
MMNLNENEKGCGGQLGTALGLSQNAIRNFKLQLE